MIRPLRLSLIFINNRDFHRDFTEEELQDFKHNCWGDEWDEELSVLCLQKPNVLSILTQCQGRRQHMFLQVASVPYGYPKYTYHRPKA
jgi:hypothetical protein